jgi:hypothetical protein
MLLPTRRFGGRAIGIEKTFHRRRKKWQVIEHDKVACLYGHDR